MELKLPPKWVSVHDFEHCLNQFDPHRSQDPRVEIQVPEECKILIQTALMLVSLINQLTVCGKRVVLSFGSVGDTYNYLSRMGFFECLAREVEVRPERPPVSGAEIYGGGNPALVEIHEVPPGKPQAVRGLPGLLAESLRQSLYNRPDAETIEARLMTVLTEVLDNVYQHSCTPIAGFVALQPYLNAVRPRVVLAISDSGHGIPDTLREAEPHKFRTMTETDIIIKVFRDGLSRFGVETGRGCGLQRCAQIALRYRAELLVRIPTAVVRLVPGQKGYERNRAFCRDDAPLLRGTHLCFDFFLTS